VPPPSSGPTGLAEGITLTCDVRPSSLAHLIQGRRTVASWLTVHTQADQLQTSEAPQCPPLAPSKVNLSLHAMKAHKEEWRCSSTHSEPRCCMEVSGESHARPLYPRESPPVSVEYEGGFSPEPPWKFRRRDLPLPGFECCIVQSVDWSLYRGPIYTYTSVRSTNTVITHVLTRRHVHICTQLQHC
jgi:hypothetical protein